MKVLKFGGTSVGSVESLTQVKKIVETIPGNAVIVVSALGGLTDKLIATAKLAAAGNAVWKPEFESMKQRHLHIINTMVPLTLRDNVISEVCTLFSQLQRIYEGLYLIKALPEKILDETVSFGERCSSWIVAAIIKNGIRHDSLKFIKTEKWYGKNVVEGKITSHLIAQEFNNLQENEKAIVPGFISSDYKTGEITNLGRGGSDFTGALIAAALGAETLEIWTDVDGFMTSDPRIVKNARITPHLTFSESMELCSFGAKVIYPPTIFPVFHKNIPIKILNTFNPEAPGTLITDVSFPDDPPIKGVTALNDLSLIKIRFRDPLLKESILIRTFKILSENAYKIIPVSNSDSDDELHFVVNASDSALSLKMLNSEFAPEIGQGLTENPVAESNVSALALVGNEMKERYNLLSRVLYSLQRKGITVKAVGSPTSNTTLLFIIDEHQVRDALNLTHSLLY